MCAAWALRSEPRRFQVMKSGRTHSGSNSSNALIHMDLSIYVSKPEFDGRTKPVIFVIHMWAIAERLHE